MALIATPVVGVGGRIRAQPSEKPQPTVEFEKGPSKIGPSRLTVSIDGRPVATYVYRDDAILRPYFAHVKAPDGTQVTRNHPPIEGRDRMDHATMHPGLWLAFGRLGDADFWRNRRGSRVEQVRFAGKPAEGRGEGHFTVVNRYVSDGETICEETSRVSFHVRPAGYLIVFDSVFESAERELVFGDQQEMGLGVRVATPLAVKDGGRMIDSAGRIDEREIWGKTSKWCDVSGTIDSRRAGILLMPHPGNFRPCRFHARDYGALVANPFGVKDFGQGEESRVIVEPGEELRLRFGVLLHSGPSDRELDREAAYADFLKVAEDGDRDAKKADGPNTTTRT